MAYAIILDNNQDQKFKNRSYLFDKTFELGTTSARHEKKVIYT